MTVEQQTRMSVSKGRKTKSYMQSTKSTMPAFKCKHCGRPFKTFDGFERHLATKHDV